MAQVRLIERVKLDNTLLGTVEGFLPAYSDGQALLVVQSPRSSANYTCELDFMLANKVIPTRRPAAFNATVQVENPVDSGLFETWFEYVYPIGDDITSAAASNSSIPLDVVAVFIDSTTFEEFRSETASFPITKSNQATSPTPEQSVVDAIYVDINKKRDKSATDLVLKATPDAADVFTYEDGTDGFEKKLSAVDLKNFINEDTIGRVAFTTGYDSGINDPVVGFGNFSELVESTADPRYPTAGAQIDFTTTLINTYEPVLSTLYPLGFFNGTNFVNLQFVNNFTLRTTGTTTVAKIEYYKLDDPDDLVGELLGSTEITFSDPAFTLQSKSGILTGPFSIDPNMGELIGARVYVKSTGIGDVISSQIGGVDPKTFTSWQISSGDFSASKMNIILSPVVGNLIEQQADGNTKDSGVPVISVARKETDDTITGTWIFNELLTTINDMLIGGNLVIDGNLLVLGESFVAETALIEMEDLIPLFGKDNVSDILDLGIEWEQATTNASLKLFNSTDGKWRLGLLGAEKPIAFIQESATANIAVYNATSKEFETQTPTQVKALLAIAIGDVVGLTAALAAKLETIEYKKDGTLVRAGTKLNFSGSLTVTPDPGDSKQVNVTILGSDGTGNGKLIVAEANVTTPVIVLTTPTIMPLTLKNQSDTLGILEFDDTNDKFLLKKTGIEGVPVQYKTTIQPQFTNSNTTVGIVEFIYFLDGVEITRRSVVASPAKTSPSADGANAVPAMCWTTTNPLEAQQELTYQVECDVLGVTITSATIAVETSFVVGENASNLMFTTIYDINAVGKIDYAQVSEKSLLNVLANSTLANYFTNGNTILPDNSLIYIETNGAVDTGANAQFSLDNEVQYYPVYETDGTTPRTGLDVQNSQELYWFDTNKFVLFTTESFKLLKARVLDLENTRALIELTFSTTVAVVDWTGSDPVTATKAVAGILTTDDPIQDLDLSAVAFVNIDAKETEYAKIYLGTTSTDQVVFSAKTAPTEELIITLKVGGR